MKIIINGQALFISNEAFQEVCDIISEFIRANPFNLECLKDYDLCHDQSVVPFHEKIVTHLLETYDKQSLPRRVMVSGIARAVLLNMEKHIGVSARPDK